ncbi:nucleotide sugar dehydrogenase [Methanosarcinales archaeon]|nr:MAG: nucleotide sugar dehydrogenase [Methanosarcinales archaeon]
MKIYGLTADEIHRKLRSGDVSVAVFGIGKIGLPIAAIFASKGVRVEGVDVKEEVVKCVNRCENPLKEEPGLSDLLSEAVSSGRLSATTDAIRAARDADVMIIAVPTLLDDRRNPDLSAVMDVCDNISAGLEKGDIVITASTLPPKTTRDVIVPFLEKRSGMHMGEFGVAHCPERVSSGRAIEDMTRAYPQIVGGADEKSTETAAAIYSLINEKGVIRVSDATTAEAVKVFEGVYRDVNIALANQLAMICEEIGIDAIETIKAANTQPYCNIHMPGCGVGGHCIPVYPYFLINTVDTDTSLLKIARRINDEMPEHTVELLWDALKSYHDGMKDSDEMSTERPRILVLGLTFRGGVRETRYSPALKIIDVLKDSVDVFAYDPIMERSEIERYAPYMHPYDAENLDAIIIASDHEEFKRIDWKIISERMRRKIIIDGRNVCDADEMHKLRFKYLRIGYAPCRGVSSMR